MRAEWQRAALGSEGLGGPCGAHGRLLCVSGGEVKAIELWETGIQKVASH